MPITLGEFDHGLSHRRPRRVPDRGRHHGRVQDWLLPLHGRPGRVSYLAAIPRDVFKPLQRPARPPSGTWTSFSASKSNIEYGSSLCPTSCWWRSANLEATSLPSPTQAFSQEFRLCLLHPSVCMTKDPKFCAEEHARMRGGGQQSASMRAGAAEAQVARHDPGTRCLSTAPPCSRPWWSAGSVDSKPRLPRLPP